MVTVSSCALSLFIQTSTTTREDIERLDKLPNVANDILWGSVVPSGTTKLLVDAFLDLNLQDKLSTSPRCELWCEDLGDLLKPFAELAVVMHILPVDSNIKIQGPDTFGN